MHAAARRAREADEWWGDAMTTALAAVALARHPPALRGDAEGALDRLERWRTEGGARATTADASALALGARASADLQRGNPALVSDAEAALSGLLGRDRLDIPDLHMALTAWALDGLLPDRAAAPWPAMRGRLQSARTPHGVDEPLRRLTTAIAAERFEASILVQEMLQTVAMSPSVADACVLSWILTAAIDRMSPVLPATDNALLVLIARRAGIIERLVESVDDQASWHGDLAADDTNVPALQISTDEALLVDSALASREETAPWVTYEEAGSLFGQLADRTRDDLARALSRGFRAAAALVVVLGACSGAIVWLAGNQLGWPNASSTQSAMATAASMWALAFLVARRDPQPIRGVARLTVAFITFSVLAWVLTINSLQAKPFVADVPGLLVATGISVVVTLLPLTPLYGARSAAKNG